MTLTSERTGQSLAEGSGDPGGVFQMYKTFLAGTAAVLAVLSLGPAAEAGTRIGVTVGAPWPAPDYSPAYPVYDPGYPDDEDDYDDEDGISCGEGRRILRDYGFWDVRPVRCGGEVYRLSLIHISEPTRPY